MSTFTLRPYQQDLVRSVMDAYLDGDQRVLTILATGGGKTPSAISLAHILCPPNSHKRVLWLVHRKGLAYQALDTFRSFYDVDQLGLVQADNNDVDRQVVVSVIATIQEDDRRKQVLAHGKFSLIIVDEAHHSLAPGFRKVLNDSLTDNGLLVGITATAERSDSQSLAQIYKLVYAKGMLDLMTETDPITQRPYLADLKGYTVKTKLNISTEHLEDNQDFSDDMLWHAAQKDPDRYHEAAVAYKQWGENKPFLLFAINIHDSENFVAAFNAEGIPAIGVYGYTDDDECERVMGNTALGIKGAFEKGEYKIVCSVGKFTEGFDAPWLGGAIIARNVRFRGLYIQMIGRLTRLCSNHSLWPQPKTYGIVIDLADNNHHCYTLNHLPGTMEAKTPSLRRAIAEKKPRTEETDPFWQTAESAMRSYRLKGTKQSVYDKKDGTGDWHYDEQAQAVRLATPYGTYELRSEGGTEVVRAFRLTAQRAFEITKNGPTDLSLARGLVLQDVYQHKSSAETQTRLLQSTERVSPKTLELAKRYKLNMINQKMTEGQAQTIINAFYAAPKGTFHRDYYASRRPKPKNPTKSSVKSEQTTPRRRIVD